MRNRKEYTVINLIAEYEGHIAEFRYAIASVLPEEKLRKKYRMELNRYEPYLYLTAEQGQAIMDSIRNNDKHIKRQKNTYDFFGYSDGATELRNGGNLYFRTLENDPLMQLIHAENWKEWEMICREEIPRLMRAIDELTEVQRRRIRMRYFQRLSESQIASAEQISREACRESLQAALVRLRKLMDRKD